MHIPKENLSLLTTRADSGAGGSQTKQNTVKNEVRFDKILDKEMDRNDRKTHGDKKPRAGNTGSSRTVKKAEQVKTGRNNEIGDDKGAAQAAGVSPINDGTQEQTQQVVFILEGEESVTTPQRAQDDIPPVINQEATNTQETNADKTGSTQEIKHADDSETAQFKDVLAAKTEAAPQNKEDVAGEVTARTPELKSETENTSKKSDDNLKDNGNPSHLENDNDKAQVKGQDANDKSYTDALKAVKEKTEETKTEQVQSIDTTQTAMPIGETIKTQQFQGIQQMTKASLSQPVKPENLFQAMIDRVETMQNAEKSTMTIQLNPEHLGKVMLEVGVDTAGVHVKINAEDTNVRNSINTQINTLIQSLESKGIAVSEVEVVFAGANFDHFSSAGDGRKGEQGGSNHSSKQGNNTKDSVEYYTTLTDLMDYYLDTGVSSMEFKA